MADADLPVGFKLDALPAGFKLDPPSRLQMAGQEVGAALKLPGKFAGKLIEGMDKAAYGAGGLATDAATAAGASPETAGAIGAGTNAALQVLPGAVSGAAFKAPFEWASKRFMQSALKPTSHAIANGDAAKAITTMLEDGINATPGGAAKIRFEVDKLKRQVNNAIATAPEGTTVDKAWGASEVMKVLDDFKNHINPGAPREEILKIWSGFKDAFPDKIPVQQAQDVKTFMQRQLANAYGKLNATPAAEATEKAVTAGMRKGIADAVPAVAAPNARMSSLLNVLDQLEPKAMMGQNSNLTGFAPLGHSPETAALMLADRNPWIKSALARILYGGREAIPAGLGGAGTALHDASGR